MANHCSNDIYITGSVKDVEEIVTRLNFYKEANGSGEYELIYYGETYYTLFKKKYPHYYEGCKDFDVNVVYGSKWWNVSHYEILEGDFKSKTATLYINSYSAWGPVTGICEKLAADYDCDVELQYCESGMDFAGVNRYDNTGCYEERDMSSHEYDYEYNYESFKDNLFDSLGDYDTYEEFLEEYEPAINIIKQKGNNELLKALEEEGDKVYSKL